MKIFKQQFIKDKVCQKGFASLLIVLILSIVFISLSISMTKTNLTKFKLLEDIKNSRKAYYLAESGIEDTIYQLFESISYPGNPTGEVTPIGTYYTTVTSLGEVYTITSYATEVKTLRSVNLNINISYELAPVTTKATYMADTFWMSGEGARIRGDVWTNDDFEVIENGIVEGNLTAAGKGSFAVNWIWDGVIGGDPELEGGSLIDNPVTPEVEGNLVAADNVKVAGPTAYVQGNVTSDKNVYELWGGTIDGVITENAGIPWQEIPVPQFQFEEYEQQALIKDTYFSNSNSFLTYLSSLDNGIEIRLPDDLYYIHSGVLRINPGTPIYLDGIIIVEESLYIHRAWYQNAVGGLPAIVCGKDLNIGNKFNFASGQYDFAGPVRINGIVYGAKRIDLFRTFANEDIIVNGAVWAGDDIFIMEHTFINYNVDPLNVIGFDFVNGISDVQKNYWNEVL